MSMSTFTFASTQTSQENPSAEGSLPVPAEAVPAEKVPSSELALTPLSPGELAIANFIEESFWRTGGIVSIEALVREFPEYNERKIERLFDKPNFQRSLSARGIPSFWDTDSDEVPDSSKGLTLKQLVAANVMLNYHDVRTEREKLDALGISSQQWHAWRRDPKFAGYLRDRSEAAFGANDYEAYEGLSKLVRDGDLAAIKLHLEMRQIYNPKVTVNVNLQGVLIQIVDILSRHVKDPDVLGAISDELGQLEMAG